MQRWNKPIVVICNESSYSNAEIFSHAIKTLKRGKVVGVTTAGCVISTGGTGLTGRDVPPEALEAIFDLNICTHWI